MPKVLVLYHSTYGHTERMAQAIAEGAREIEGAVVDIKRVPELVPDELAKKSGYKMDQDAPIAEVDDLADVGLRTQRVLELSAELRSWVGPDYPMAAIVLPPMQLEVNTTWWPGFPYAELAEHYDVFVPMSCDPPSTRYFL